MIITDAFMEDWPWRTGVWFARMNEDCDPESIYKDADCIVHFVLGYESIKGSSERTKGLLQTYEPLLIHLDEITVAQMEDIRGDKQSG